MGLNIAEDEIDLLSVGIDVGSSTSHLIFSTIKLKKIYKNVSQKFEVVEREILYESDIIDTPLLDKETINMNALLAFFEEEYKNAGITKSEVQTGAVIVTGETAKKKNAETIVKHLARNAGDFVSASAGPNYEAMLSAFGSGAVQRSKNKRVISCDIGGGTSNIALSINGKVVDTSCISIGGRIIAFDERRRIIRLDAPGKVVLKAVNLHHTVGSLMSDDEIELVTQKLAKSLLRSIFGKKPDDFEKQLLLTENITVPENMKTELVFSGGVAEMIYSDKQQDFNDIGSSLADAIKKELMHKGIVPSEPEQKIRATVIGAGSYTLQVSGNTCFLDSDDIKFPLNNIPVIHISVNREELSSKAIQQGINAGFKRFDITLGKEMVALSFNDPVKPTYTQLKIFAEAIERALEAFIQNEIPIILVFDRDVGNSIGNVIRRETVIKTRLACIDEVEVSDGDWLDIGSPLINGQIIPITVKNLVFAPKE